MTRVKKEHAVGVALAMLLVGCTGAEAPESAALSTTAVVRGNLRIVAEATGTAEPVLNLEVKSKASGEVLRLHVDVGDEVAVGTLLAEIDPRDVVNRYQQAEADLTVSEAQVKNARAQLARSEELQAAGVITVQELESAELSAANAEAGLIRSQTNLELADLQRQDVTIRAPTAGTILARSVEVGTVIQSASQNVSGGSVLFRMANLASMQVRTLVDETDMGELEAGLAATVTVEAYPDRVFQGVVERIEPQAVVQQNVTMFAVIVRLDNRSGFLKPGMNSEVEILIDEAGDVLLVPNNAIVDPGDVGPAALALGLDIEDMDLTAFRTTGRFGGAMGGRGGRGGDRRGGEASGEGAPAAGADNGVGSSGGEGRGGLDMQALRAQVQSGAITQDSMRALMQAQGFGGRGQGSRGEARGGGDFPGFGGRDSGTVRQTRRAVVFVVADSLSPPVPTLVEIGLNDWDQTQIVSGVEEGTLIAIVGAAQLQAQQQEFLDRMRGFGGGNPFGGGRGRGR